jgi:hypothetical protein
MFHEFVGLWYHSGRIPARAAINLPDSAARSVEECPEEKTTGVADEDQSSAPILSHVRM